MDAFSGFISCTQNIQLYLIEPLNTAGPSFRAGVHVGPQRGIQQHLWSLEYEQHILAIPNWMFSPSPKAMKSAPYLIDARNWAKVA